MASFSLFKPKYKPISLVFVNLRKSYLRILAAIEKIIYMKKKRILAVSETFFLKRVLTSASALMEATFAIFLTSLF